MADEFRNRNPGGVHRGALHQDIGNITRGTIQRIPISGVVRSAEMRQALRTPGRRAELISKQTTGAVLVGTGAVLQSNGIITGAMAGSPDQRRAAYKQGLRPYSVRTTDEDGNVVYY